MEKTHKFMMKSLGNRSKKHIVASKLEKMSTFNQSHDTEVYQVSPQSTITIRKTLKMPGKNSPSLYDYLIQKINSETKLYCNYQIPTKSMVRKHKFNLQKRLYNLRDVMDIFRELHEEEKLDLKKEIEEIKVYKEFLIDGYKRYECKLKKIQKNRLQKKRTAVKKRQYAELGAISKTYKKSTQRLSLFSSRISSQQQLVQKRSLFYEIKSEQKQDEKQVDITETTKFDHQSLYKNSEIDQMMNQIDIFSQEEKLKMQLQTQIKEKQAKLKFLNQNFDKQKQKISESKKSQRQLERSTQCSLSQKSQVNSEISSLQKTENQLKGKIQKSLQDLEKVKYQNVYLKNTLSDLALINFMIVVPIKPIILSKKCLNNQLQELRGTIRVYCRIRPLKIKQNLMRYELKSHDYIQIKKTIEDKKSENIKTDFKFVFDRIFDQKASQQEVFSEISQLIQNAIDGVNVCIFAYGQTGSGKTFTMQGNSSKGNQSMGLIPRSTQLIFTELQKYRENGWQTTLEVSINEIYNDAVFNLSQKSQNKLSKPVFTVTKTIKQVQDLFKKAISNRSTAFTLSNADSSRSHLIFIIRIKSKSALYKESSFEKESHLVLVDLAGSERVKESGVSNKRLKEAQHINSSLSQLGQVIRSLKNNKGKTNFRNSKLTYFLEPYLQKGSKAIMFVNISPSVSDESQSINSLKFASTAKECKLQGD